MTRKTTLMAALATAVLLAACGGGGSDAAPAPATTVPADAQTTPEAYTAFTAAQPEDEQREPLTLDGVLPPTSETAEPAPVQR